ncbi:MAG: 4Fe-4S dicluster domain-containing protein [Gammaproteobacteria bacterium]|nr:4Fe-4S dicluster domain-containing protein [Gammaproteobacteria bacterium]
MTAASEEDTETPRPKKRYGMLIDLNRCIGCHACSVACKSEFDVPLGETRSWVEYIERGNYPHVSRSFLPRLCNHCSEPQCVDVCPTGATWVREDTGIVHIDPDICIGCKYCMMACPYGMRFINPMHGSADKCNFCEHRVDQGVDPACVQTCVGHARIFGDLNDPDSTISQMLSENNDVSVLRPEMGTKPNVFYIGADHSDPNTTAVAAQYLRIDTNRRQKERV